jgi:hypothetical protein
VNECKSEYLNLNVPNSGREIQGILSCLIGKRGDFGVAVDCRNGRAGQELIGRADRTTLGGTSQNGRPKDDAGKQIQIGSHGLYISG